MHCAVPTRHSAGCLGLALGLALLPGLAIAKSFECPDYPAGTEAYDITRNCTLIITANGYTIDADVAVLFRYTGSVTLNQVMVVGDGASLEIEKVPDYTWFTCATGCHYYGQ